MISAVVATAVVVLSVLAIAGVFRSSSGGTGTTYTPVAYSAAAPLATTGSQSASGGPWTIVGAEGVGVPSEVAQTNLSSIGGGGCTFSPVPGGATNVSVPATPSGTSPGKVSVWVFFAKNASLDSILIISVVRGHAAPLSLITDCSVVKDFAGLDVINANAVVDSTKVASEFNQDGGAAFLQNKTWGVQLFILLGPSSATGGSPIWDVKYSTCSVSSTAVPGSWLSAYYYANTGKIVTPPTPGSGTCN